MELNAVVENLSFWDILKKEGYTIIRSVTVNEKGSVKYVKAYNVYGNIVYIYLDITDEILYDDGERNRFIVKEFAGSSRIPHSSISSLNSTPHSSGKVFECNDELCVLIRKNDGGTEKNVYRVYDPIKSESIISLDNGISGYPLIRVSEIIMDPEGTLIRTSEISEYILSESLDQIKRESNRLSETLADLIEVNDTFVDESVKTLKSINVEKNSISRRLASTSDEAKAENLRRNVFLREAQRDKILKLQKEIFSVRKVLQQVKLQIEMSSEVVTHLHKEFPNSEEILIYSREDTERILRI